MLSLPEAITLANTPNFLYKHGIQYGANLPEFSPDENPIDELIELDKHSEDIIAIYELFFRILAKSRMNFIENIPRLLACKTKWINELCKIAASQSFGAQIATNAIFPNPIVEIFQPEDNNVQSEISNSFRIKQH